MSRDIAIQASGLGKRYRLGSALAKHDSLRDVIAAGVGRLYGGGRNSDQAAKRDFWALRDVSFEIARGENVGIIGLNGAGKSTLLKVLSRITEPTTGHARIAGRVGALLEVGTGFHGDLTGRENVFLYGSILGMSKAEVARKFDAIVDFAEIEQFIDTPVKRYSSGMYVRLAFAVAAHLEPEILFLDEVLSVGDLPFQRKCMEFAKNLQKKDATLLFVSHNMFSIKTMCSRVLYLKQGHIVFDGTTDEGIGIYEEQCRLTSTASGLAMQEGWPISIKEFSILGEDGQLRSVFEYGERIIVRLTYEPEYPVDNPNFIVAILRSDGVACCNYSSELDGLELGQVSGLGALELRTPPMLLVSDLYTIHIIVRERGFQKQLCGQVGGIFHVRHELLDHNFGVFHQAAQWAVAHLA